MTQDLLHVLEQNGGTLGNVFLALVLLEDLTLHHFFEDLLLDLLDEVRYFLNLFVLQKLQTLKGGDVVCENEAHLVEDVLVSEFVDLLELVFDHFSEHLFVGVLSEGFEGLLNGDIGGLLGLDFVGVFVLSREGLN